MSEAEDDIFAAPKLDERDEAVTHKRKWTELGAADERVKRILVKYIFPSVLSSQPSPLIQRKSNKNYIIAEKGLLLLHHINQLICLFLLYLVSVNFQFEVS